VIAVNRAARAAYLARARAALDDLGERALRRRVRVALPADAIDFSSNDYLGLARDPRVVAALSRASRVASGGARLLGGAHVAHAALEEELASFVRRERALLFSSGYLAALGGIGTLATLVARVVSDASIHACLIDGIRLVKIPRAIVPHGELAGFDFARESGGTLAVTESLYGMDGDAPDLAGLIEALGPNDVAFVDEAHSLGVAGPRGAGLCASFDDERIVVFGTLSKALGAAGGFIAGPREIVELAQSIARGFIFDTSAPPALVEAARAALAVARSDEGEALRERLRANVARVRAGLASFARPVDVAVAHTHAHEHAPIVPLVIGDAADTLALGAELEARGIFAPAIRPPTVPHGTSRLRITVRADHEAFEIDRLIAILGEALSAADARPAVAKSP
jgi:8-amino-7-oxononanoate synthase